MRIRVALGTRLKSILQAALRQQNLSSDDMSCQGMFDRLVAESDPVTAQIRLYAYQPIPFEERVLMRPSQGVIHSITLPDQTQLDCTHYSIYGLGATRPIPVNASNFEGMIGKIILSANSLPELLTQQHLQVSTLKVDGLDTNLDTMAAWLSHMQDPHYSHSLASFPNFLRRHVQKPKPPVIEHFSWDDGDLSILVGNRR